MSWNGSSGGRSAKTHGGKKQSFFPHVPIVAVVVVVAVACGTFLCRPAKDAVNVANTKSSSLRVTAMTPRIHVADVNIRRTSGNSRGEKVADADGAEVNSKASDTESAADECTAQKQKTKPMFDSTTEMILARIFSTKLGDPVPMVPEIPCKEIKNIANIIERNTAINDDDDPETIEMKQIADLAKDEFVKFINAGGDDAEFIAYYQAKLSNYHDEWKEAQRSLIEVAKDGDYESTIAYMNKVNAMLEAKGIKHVRLPPLFRKED